MKFIKIWSYAVVPLQHNSLNLVLKWASVYEIHLQQGCWWCDPRIHYTASMALTGTTKSMWSEASVYTLYKPVWTPSYSKEGTSPWTADDGNDHNSHTLVVMKDGCVFAWHVLVLSPEYHGYSWNMVAIFSTMLQESKRPLWKTGQTIMSSALSCTLPSIIFKTRHLLAI